MVKPCRIISRYLAASGLLVLQLVSFSTHAQSPSPTTGHTVPAGKPPVATLRERFTAAERALAANDRSRFKQLADTLRDYPLYPYLRHADLAQRLDTADSQEVAGFLAAYSDTPLAWQLRHQWLKHLAMRGKWHTFLDFYRPTADIDLQCHQLRALLATGRARQALPRVEALWLHGRSRPKACDPVFDQWIKAGNPSPKLAWKRIDLAMDQGQLRLARYLRRFLPARERPWVDYWLGLHRHPERVTHLSPPAKQHPYLSRMQIDAIRQLARRDGLAALQQWQRLSANRTFSRAQHHAVQLRLATALFDEPADAAYRYISALRPRSADTSLQELKLRAALLRRDWRSYLSWQAELAPATRDKPRWLYWQARALAEQGEQQAAKALYRRLAEERSYHGFLAADRAGLPYALETSSAPADEALLARLRKNPALRRARELLALEHMLEARREWQWGTRRLNHKGLITAAKLAEEWRWHDQAIRTIAQGKYWDDLDLRFPLAHRETVEHQAERQQLDPAWVYAVVRQESAFMADARSHVGAAGLMQLMPATARHVARRLPEQPQITHAALKQPGLNIALGSAYLREVLDRLHNNRVLATAAYNAGPHRVQQWLPDTATAADLWIERIPFRETRRYLRRVLTYTAIYQARLGQQPQRLLEQMPDIQPEESYARNEETRAFPG